MTARVGVAGQARPTDASAALTPLRGLVQDDILEAPRTAGHPPNLGQWPVVPERVVKYLVRSVAGTPWMDHLVLAAAIQSARHLDPSTILVHLTEMHSRFRGLPPALGLTSMAELNSGRTWALACSTKEGTYRGRYDTAGWHAASTRSRVRQLRSSQLPLRLAA